MSENLLPEGNITQAMGPLIALLGPYSNWTSHTKLADWNDANPGDLVMATASDIGHPACSMGTISCSYALLGRVVDFVYIDWDTGNIDEDWDGIVCEHTRAYQGPMVGCRRKEWQRLGCYSSRSQWVKVIGAKVDGKLEGVNAFLNVEIAKSFYHTKQMGLSAFKLE